MENLSKLELSLYGAFDCRWSDGRSVVLSGKKTRGLIAMLAIAANGVHSRKWLQEHLWALSGEELGRQSLRRCLSDLRKCFGADFNRLFEINNIEIRLLQENIRLVSGQSDGQFLAGISIQEPAFKQWLAQKREAGQPVLLQLDSDSRLVISPSVAVLPFIAVSGGASENHLGDLVAMDVARALSRSRFLDVISHLSSRQLGAGQRDLRLLKSKLNADYVISGHIRVDDHRYRLDADFIQTSTGRILWTESFHGKIGDILQGESELVARIARQCGQEILRASVEIAQSAPLPQVAAHALFMASITGMHQHHLASFARSRDNLEELISRVPRYSKLHAWLAKWYIFSIAQGWSTDVKKDSAIAADCTARALDINPNCATSLTIDGMIQGDRNDDMSVSSARFEAAIESDPNQGLAWLMFSRMNSFFGKADLAIKYAEKARRLSPIDPHGYFYDIMDSTAHMVAGNYEKAQELAKESLRKNPRHTSSYRVLAIALQLAGNKTEARKTMGLLRRVDPNLTVQGYLAAHPAGKLPVGLKWATALGDAGLPQM